MEIRIWQHKILQKRTLMKLYKVQTTCHHISHLMYRSSPEIVEEDVCDRCLWPQVSVLLYSTDVIEDEAAVQAIMVD